MQKSIVADAVGAVVGGEAEVVVAQWSEHQVSLIQGAAEMMCDAVGDTAKALDQVKDAFVEAFKSGGLTFELWEDGRKRYEAAFVLRADLQAKTLVNPPKQANDNWNQVVVPFLKMYKLEKPKSGGKDAVRKAEKREKVEAEAKTLAAGRSLEEVKEAQLAAYKTATAESIAEAKALDKAIEFLEKDVKSDLQKRLKVLKDAFRKVAQEVAKLDDEVALADAIVALKRYIKSAV